MLVTTTPGIEGRPVTGYLGIVTAQGVLEGDDRGFACASAAGIWPLQPAGAGAPGGGARRGRDRRMAGQDVGEGTRLAAAPARISASRMRPGRTCARPKRGPGPAAAAPRWSRCPARARGGSRWPGWCACGRAAGVTCSTGSASTAGARVSAARCPKPDYVGLIAAAHNQLHAPVILIWDNRNTHISAAMQVFIQAHRE